MGEILLVIKKWNYWVGNIGQDLIKLLSVFDCEILQTIF